MPEIEPVIIQIRANDQATKVIEDLSKTLLGLQKQVNSINFNNINFKGLENLSKGISITPIMNSKNIQRQTTNIITSITDEFQGFRNLMNDPEAFGALNLQNTKKAWEQLNSPTKQFQNYLDGLDFSPISNLNSSLQIAGLSQKKFNQWANKNFWVEKDGMMFNQLTQQTMAYGAAVNNAVLSTRRFNMSLLSVLFAGMAVDRIFAGIIKNQMSLYGITQTTSDMWTLTMAPAMDLIIPKLYNILDMMMSLPESQKIVIGFTVLGIDLIAKGVVFFAQLGLAIQGFKTIGIGAVLSEMVAGFSSVSASVLALTGGIMGLVPVIAIVVGVVVGMFTAWNSNFAGMKDTVQIFVNSIKVIFSGLIQIFKGVFDVIRGLFSGDGELIINGFKNLVVGFGKLIGGLVTATMSAIAGIATGAVKIILDVISGVINTLGAIPKLWGGKVLWKVDFASNFNDMLNKLPKYEDGGIVPFTGPAIVHQGEMIIPKNQVGKSQTMNVSYTPQITVNATVSNDYDVRDIAKEVNKYFAADFERIIKARGSI